MGRRYCAILNMLNVRNYVIDIGTSRALLPHTTGLIVATPTDTHYEILLEYHHHELPILCEKPITKNPAQLAEILDFTKTIRMINQYAYWFKDKSQVTVKSYVYPDGASNKKCHTYYNYYHSGLDGLVWDCTNIIGLSRNESIVLGQDSPIWECWINGGKISREEMDDAYIWNIEDWLEKLDDNRKYIIETDKKVRAYNDRCCDMHTNPGRK